MPAGTSDPSPETSRPKLTATPKATPRPRSGVGLSSRAFAVIVAIVVVAAGTLVVLHLVDSGGAGTGPGETGSTVQIVAAENFWGSLVSQLGGAHVQVLSVVSDPNADPHEYQSNTSDAVAIANARFVIENGAGYDDWCSQLVASSDQADRTVLNVANLLGAPAGANPHFWYGQANVKLVVAAMYSDLVAIDPGEASYFQQQYATLNVSLASVWSSESYIDVHWGNGATEVASTESIFVYMANSTGLDLVSPPAFMDAVAEGDDPPTQSVTQFQDQLESGHVSVLVYNEQTVTPLTDEMKSIAVQHNVTIVGVTETIQPPNETFQFWMSAELADLTNALNGGALSQ